MAGNSSVDAFLIVVDTGKLLIKQPVHEITIGAQRDLPREARSDYRGSMTFFLRVGGVRRCEPDSLSDRLRILRGSDPTNIFIAHQHCCLGVWFRTDNCRTPDGEQIVYAARH